MPQFLRPYRPLLGLLLVLASLVPLSGCAKSSVSSAAAASPRVLDIDSDELRGRIDQAIDVCRRRHLVAESNAAWQVVHGILAFGPDLQLDVQGKPTSALKYLQDGGRLSGWNLVPGDKGLEAILEAGSKSGQGHEDQWLGYMSLCGLKDDTPFLVAGRKYTIRDLVTQAQWDIYDGMEATWSLMGFTAYLPRDVKWTAKNGAEWTIERVVAMEATQDLTTSACGGTHRLTALTVALKRHVDAGGQLTGGWKTAHDVIYGTDVTPGAIGMARMFQQPDGSFSSNYFDAQRPASTADVGQRLGTTGHTLEFLALALPEQELRSQWMIKAVVALCDMVEETQPYELECGGLYHAARGLEIYRERRFGSAPAEKATATALRAPVSR
ncbi:MAG: ADP-ribosylation factor-directed GTPase activating protein isoform b [Planctomycetia bacterium]|nr:ADP-ribosylation factor-directed GTPase activating protein isoform b [Planctomycetia bacterium]